MWVYPEINPVFLTLGPLEVHWYGVMYLLGFAMAWRLGRLRSEKTPALWDNEAVSDLIFYVAIGVVLGGRLGYMLFYAFPVTGFSLTAIFEVYKGGMSFHGGLLGVLLAVFWFAKKTSRDFFAVTDFLAPLVPPGLAAGRIGNFINGELWGRVTEMPWGMVFPHVDRYPRHPSQLYEFLLEGVLIFSILWFYTRRVRPKCAASGLFLLLYGSCRIMVECFREPDAQFGYFWDILTMGQLLSIPLVLLGGVLLRVAYQKEA